MRRGLKSGGGRFFEGLREEEVGCGGDGTEIEF
jgi:hypothetical protein